MLKSRCIRLKMFKAQVYNKVTEATTKQTYMQHGLQANKYHDTTVKETASHQHEKVYTTSRYMNMEPTIQVQTTEINATKVIK